MQIHSSQFADRSSINWPVALPSVFVIALACSLLGQRLTFLWLNQCHIQLSLLVVVVVVVVMVALLGRWSLSSRRALRGRSQRFVNSNLSPLVWRPSSSPSRLCSSSTFPFTLWRLLTLLLYHFCTCLLILRFHFRLLSLYNVSSQCFRLSILSILLKLFSSL